MFNIWPYYSRFFEEYVMFLLGFVSKPQYCYGLTMIGLLKGMMLDFVCEGIVFLF